MIPRASVPNHLPSMFVTKILIASLAILSQTNAFSIRSATPARVQTFPSTLSMTVESVETKDTVKVGVIGMGRIGLVHLEAISKAPGVIPVIVSNPTVSKAENGKKKNIGTEETHQECDTYSESHKQIFDSRKAVQHPAIHGKCHGCHHRS